MIKFEYSILQTFILIGTIVLLMKVMIPRVALAQSLPQIRERLSQPGYILCLFAAFVASVIDYLETHFDSRVTRAIHKDFTPLVARFGTHWVERVQHHRLLPLTYVFTYAYVWVFPAIMLALFFVFVYRDQEELAQFLTAAYFMNLLFALPFYLLFPVNEVWASDSHVRLLTDRISPLIMDHYRSISALDNCFPSFHASLAILIAVAAWRSRDSRTKWLATACSVLVVASTLYLGIHWPLDVLAGGVAAVFCAILSLNYGPLVFERAELRYEQLRRFALEKISM